MMLFEDILIVSDMDGTLLNSKRQFDRGNKEAIDYFINNGGSFMVATGRMETTIKDLFPYLKTNIPCIFHNGALIYDINTCEYIYEDTLSYKIKPLIIELIKKYNSGLQILGKNHIYIINENRYTREQQQREGYIPIKTDLNSVPFPWYKILIADDYENLISIEKWIKQKDNKLSTVFSEENLLDILANNTNKGNAFAYMKSKLINRKFIIAIGDSYNDIELLKNADFAVAVKNAKPEVKQVADLVIQDNDSCAIRGVINFVENNVKMFCKKT